MAPTYCRSDLCISKNPKNVQCFSESIKCTAVHGYFLTPLLCMRQQLGSLQQLSVKTRIKNSFYIWTDAPDGPTGVRLPQSTKCMIPMSWSGGGFNKESTGYRTCEILTEKTGVKLHRAVSETTGEALRNHTMQTPWTCPQQTSPRTPPPNVGWVKRLWW